MKAKSTTFLVIVGLAIIFAWFVMLPAVRDIDETRQEIEQTRQDIALLESTQGDIDDAVEFFETIDSTTKEDMALALPVFADRINLSIILDNLAQENGLIVGEVSVSEGSDPSGEATTGTVEASVTVEGSYEALKSFIASAERTLRILDVTSVSVSGGSPEDPLKFEITLKAFYLEEGAATEQASPQQEETVQF